MVGKIELHVGWFVIHGTHSTVHSTFRNTMKIKKNMKNFVGAFVFEKRKTSAKIMKFVSSYSHVDGYHVKFNSVENKRELKRNRIRLPALR